MALALKNVLSNPKLAIAGARLRAWWDGEAFDEAAAIAALEAKAANAALEAAEDALFDPEPYDLPPRLVALGLIWGEGRIRPAFGAAEDVASLGLGLSAEAVLALLGPGAIAPLVSAAQAHPGRIDVFEWREETVDALKHGIATAGLGDRVRITRIDLEAHVFPVAAYDGLISIDDFAYCSFPPHLAQQVVKCLKPGAAAVIEAYVGFKSAELATAFATSFAEPQIRAHGDVLHVLGDVGLGLQSDDDITEPFLQSVREGFRDLSDRLAQAQLDVRVAQELAWEVEAWRMRMRLLSQRRLERRRLVVRKSGDAAQASDEGGALESDPKDT